MSKKFTGLAVAVLSAGLAVALGALAFTGGCGDAVAGTGQVYSHRVVDSTITNTDLERGTLDSTRITAAGLGWKCFDDSVITGEFIRRAAITSELIGAGEVANVDIADSTIDGAAKLARGSIDSERIGAGEVKAADIATGAVTRIKMSANVLGTFAIGEDSVTTTEISDGTVANIDIADSTINASTKLIRGSIDSEKIGAGEVKTVDMADSACTTDKLDRASVTSEKIGAGEVANVDVADSTLNAATKLIRGSIDSERIGAGEVKTVDIADSACTTALIDRAAVTTEKLAAKAVHAVDVQDSTLTATQIARGTLTSELIGAGEVATVDIESGAVTVPKVDFTNATQGDSLHISTDHFKVYSDTVWMSTHATGRDSLTSKGDTCQITCGAIRADAATCVILITPLTVTVGTPYVKTMWNGGATLASNGNETAPIWLHWEAKRIAE